MTLEEQLIEHEGLRLRPYRCPAGKLTIGVGRNLDDAGISEAEARQLLQHDIAACRADLETFAWWARLTSRQQDALIDMRFNLGPRGFRKFGRMLAALAAGDDQAAAREMRASRWASQVGARARRLAAMVAGE